MVEFISRIIAFPYSNYPSTMASDDESELLYPPTSTVNPFTIANSQVERASSEPEIQPLHHSSGVVAPVSPEGAVPIACKDGN